MLWLIVESWWAASTAHGKEKNGMIVAPFIIDNRNLRGRSNFFFPPLISLRCRSKLFLIRFFLSGAFFIAIATVDIFGKKQQNGEIRSCGGVGC